jgi:hypothetical protein
MAKLHACQEATKITTPNFSKRSSPSFPLFITPNEQVTIKEMGLLFIVGIVSLFTWLGLDIFFVFNFFLAKIIDRYRIPFWLLILAMGITCYVNANLDRVPGLLDVLSKMWR